jgi:hypothetical protein
MSCWFWVSIDEWPPAMLLWLWPSQNLLIIDSYCYLIEIDPATTLAARMSGEDSGTKIEGAGTGPGTGVAKALSTRTGTIRGIGRCYVVRCCVKECVWYWYCIGERCEKSFRKHFRLWCRWYCYVLFTRIIRNFKCDFGLIFRSKERTENGVKR